MFRAQPQLNKKDYIKKIGQNKQQGNLFKSAITFFNTKISYIQEIIKLNKYVASFFFLS